MTPTYFPSHTVRFARRPMKKTTNPWFLTAGLLVVWLGVAGCGGLRNTLVVFDGGVADGPVDGVKTSDGSHSDMAQTDSGAKSCVAGTSCTPDNLCHEGQTVCSATGLASCKDTQQDQSNGTACGSGSVCHAGTCTQCSAGATCSVTGNSCRVGKIVCTTGAPVCTASDNQIDGTGCGTGMVCQSGSCVACSAGGACTP